jgi:hypothetical protein
MSEVAREHAGEAGDALRAAAGIADPYKRADAIWEAVERVNAAAPRLRGRAAARCAEIARALEEGCEAGRRLPGDLELGGHADALDRIAADPNAVPPSRESNRASQLDRPRGEQGP